ncbi:Phosphoribosylglycinamide formyltransferase 2 [compost metagenome]
MPIPSIVSLKKGASAVVLADRESDHAPTFSGLEEVLQIEGSDVRIFGKPTTRPYRRMAVVLYSGDQEVAQITDKAKELAAKISINYR